MVTGHGPFYVGSLVFDFISQRQRNHSVLVEKLWIQGTAIDGLQNSELGAISFTFRVFLYKSK